MLRKTEEEEGKTSVNNPKSFISKSACINPKTDIIVEKKQVSKNDTTHVEIKKTSFQVGKVIDSTLQYEWGKLDSEFRQKVEIEKLLFVD